MSTNTKGECGVECHKMFTLGTSVHFEMNRKVNRCRDWPMSTNTKGECGVECHKMFTLGTSVHFEMNRKVNRCRDWPMSTNAKGECGVVSQAFGGLDQRPVASRTSATGSCLIESITWQVCAKLKPQVWPLPRRLHVTFSLNAVGKLLSKQTSSSLGSQLISLHWPDAIDVIVGSSFLGRPCIYSLLHLFRFFRAGRVRL